MCPSSGCGQKTNVIARGSVTVLVQPTQGGALEGCACRDKSADGRSTASARGWKQGCKKSSSQVMRFIPELDDRKGFTLGIAS